MISGKPNEVDVRAVSTQSLKGHILELHFLAYITAALETS